MLLEHAYGAVYNNGCYAGAMAVDLNIRASTVVFWSYSASTLPLRVWERFGVINTLLRNPHRVPKS